VDSQLSELCERLNSYDPNVRLEAAEYLVQVAEKNPRQVEEAVGELRQAADDSAGKVRVKITYILTLVAEENPRAVRSAVEDLRRWLYDENDAVKLNASNVLMHISEEYPGKVVPAVDDLVRLLQMDISADAKEDILVHSTQALKNVAEDRPQKALSAVGYLVPLLSEGSARIRVNASYLLSILSEVSPEKTKTLVEDIVPRIDDGNSVVRQNLLLTLANVAEEHPKKVRPALTEVEDSLYDPDSRVREAALRTLLFLIEEYPEEIMNMDDRLQDLLSDGSEYVRTIAAWIFGDIALEKPEKVRPVMGELRKLTQDSNDIVRYSPLPAIAALEPEEVRGGTDTLRRALNHKEWSVRLSATHTLLEISREYPQDVRKAVNDLIEVLGEDELSSGAAGALAVVAREYPQDVEPATDKLRGLMHSEHEDTRLNAIFGVAEVSPDRAAEHLKELRQAMDSEWKTEREGATYAVASIAEEYPEEVRGVSSKLRELTEDADTEVRKNAKLALEHLSEGSSSHSLGVSSPSEIPDVPRLSLTHDEIEKERHIGSGGNADVHLVTYRNTDFALKEPRMSGTLHTETAERLMEEAETWDKLDEHEYIVGVVDYGSEPLPWIALEYMDGGGLDQRLGGIETEESIWLASRICEGVQSAHRSGVAHLDLKPENILFRETGKGYPDVPKVADWGLSKVLLEHSKSVEGLSTQYAAPEQFDSEGYGKPDARTDIYQLGTIFYELFTGRKPFEGQTFEVMNRIQNEEPKPPSEVSDVPNGLDRVLLKALSKNKQDRQESVLYLRDGIREAFSE
jgi:HEAT repeat protein/tRNA A-37 threonylcarbamoyl transferase component Bud32